MSPARLLVLAFFLGSLATPLGRAAFVMMFVERPTFSLLAALALWVVARLVGVASTLGYDALRELDILVTGGLTATIGCYALFCRGVSASGLVATAVLSGAYLTAVLRRYDRPGTWTAAVGAFAWVAVLYRFFCPV